MNATGLATIRFLTPVRLVYAHQQSATVTAVFDKRRMRGQNVDLLAGNNNLRQTLIRRY